ncbi:hypothetical protein J4411_01995 [Candidatus Pacearchaeota archaeon]|nr:hypothetical protein [Candidatus Pacearchaeota archaeon]
MKEVEIQKENEFFVNFFLRKLYGAPYGYSGNDKGFLTKYYPCLEIQDVKALGGDESRQKIIFLDSVNNEIKKELTKLAGASELSPYATLPKIEKIVKNFKFFWGRD